MCVFCEIAKGNIPSNKIYEDEVVLAFFDINPTSYGHALVIPKEHFDSFLTCPDEVQDHVFHVARQIANQLKETLHCDGINILSNVGESAGQTIHHFHVHIIPRYEHSKKDSVNISFGEIDKVDFPSLMKEVKR